MKKIKVITVLGTRPEIIRLSRVMACLDEYFDHLIVHTGQNYDYELNEIFFQELEIRKPDYFLDAAGDSVAATIGNIIAEVDRVLEKEQPEALLVLGDTNSCLAAYPAKRRKIPVFHMEAGNRCFDQRVPEEINRKIIDHMADINLTYSSIAREYLLAEGFPADRVIKTGSPLAEVLNYYREKINASNIIDKFNLISKRFFVVSIHREENVEADDNIIELANILNTIADVYKEPIIVSTHPRTRKRINELKLTFNKQVNLCKPFGFLDYMKLQMNARAVLSDSGTINEDSSIMNFPALNIREAHERPEGMEEGAVIMTGFNIDRIMQGLQVLVNQDRGESRTLRVVSDYTMPNVAEKIVRIIISYTDYVNRKVWCKKD